MSRSNSDRILTKGLILFAVSLSWLSTGYPEEPGTQETAKQWEEIASLRYQASIGHESRAEQKEALGSDTPGPAFSGAGDEKVSASGGYKTASKHWQKAAEAYRTTEDLDNEKKPNTTPIWLGRQLSARFARQRNFI